MLSGVLAHMTSTDALEKRPREERTRVKRWIILLFAAILIAVAGYFVRQSYLEVLGLVIILLAIGLLLWSLVQFALKVRPPTIRRRRFRRISMPHIRRRRPVQGGYTDELHAAIFQDPTAQ